MKFRDLEAPEPWTDLDPQTREWIEAFEYPTLALLADGVRRADVPVAVPDEKIDAKTWDWVKSQEFPVRPLLCAKQGPGGTAPPIWKSEWHEVPSNHDLASNLSVTVLWALEGEHFLVQQR